ncbi:MAG: hypothetical protein AAB562_02990 [Patescibacteria group bacterium]
MNPKVRQAWENFLNPDVTRSRLPAASVYIAAFEALKDSIVGRIRGFFWTGFDETGDRVDPKYQSDVLARNRSPVYASLDWLKEMNAIDEADVRAFDRVKACRNTLAHQLFSTLGSELGSESLPPDFEQCCLDMVSLLRKIEVWWISNVEIPTNPDYDGSDIDEEGILPGPIISIQLLHDIALGDEERSHFYYNEFRRQSGGG